MLFGRVSAVLFRAHRRSVESCFQSLRLERQRERKPAVAREGRRQEVATYLIGDLNGDAFVLSEPEAVLLALLRGT